MTRKEAIIVIRQMLATTDLSVRANLTKKMIEACHMAIASLETDEAYQLEYERTTKNDLGVDAVSRQALLNATVKKSSIWNHITNSEGDNLEAIVSKLPSVTPQEPKTGRWIGHREHCENLGVMPSGLGCYEWCSNCDCGIDVREWHRNNYNYCPNCGAKMESEDNNGKTN